MSNFETGRSIVPPQGGTIAADEGRNPNFPADPRDSLSGFDPAILVRTEPLLLQGWPVSTLSK